MNQGTMTSQLLVAMVRRFVAARLPGAQLEQLDKVGLLSALLESEGWRAVVSSGREIRSLGPHPVFRALVASGDPHTIAKRWLRLERFGHSRNRTELRTHELEGGTTSLTLRHVAKDAGEIVAVNDLFIWGVFIGLLELAGVDAIEAALVTNANAEPFCLHGAATDTSAPLPRVTHTLRLRGVAARATVPTSQLVEPVELVDASGVRSALVRLLQRDLLKKWSVAEAAHVLGLAPRSLQRALRSERTSFSDVVHRTRVEAAQRMLVEPRMQLTEVAFCVGFTDQAHFTRTFRRYCDVPPSAYRELLSSG